MPASASSASAAICGNCMDKLSKLSTILAASFGKRLVFDTALPSCPLAIQNSAKVGEYQTMRLSKLIRHGDHCPRRVVRVRERAAGRSGRRAGVHGGQNVSFVRRFERDAELRLPERKAAVPKVMSPASVASVSISASPRTPRVQWAAFAPDRPRSARRSRRQLRRRRRQRVGRRRLRRQLPARRQRQPLSPCSRSALQGQTGLNVAAGIVSLDLNPAAPVSASRRHSASSSSSSLSS